MSVKKLKKISIIGGGIAGLAIAIKLRQLGLQVDLFEAGQYEKLMAGEHLGADGKLEFQKLNFPIEKLNPVQLPCREVRNAWGQSSLNFNESIFNPYGDGIILTRPAFDKVFSEFAKSLGVQIFLNSRIEKIEQSQQGWSLFLKNQEEAVKTDFVIDATGRTSKFYKNFGIEKLVYDDLIGITKRVESSKKETLKTTYLLVESMPNGWWYSVQLETGVFVTTFMTDASVLQSQTINQDEFWKENLDNSIHTKERLAGLELPENCFTQSARTHKLSTFSGKNWLCVGDAAMAYDPLSSTGIIKGLRMGQDAALTVQNKLFPAEHSSFDYDNIYQEQFEAYISHKKEFYANETRWNHSEFWYKRNIQLTGIEHFSILPTTILSINADDSFYEKKLNFLKMQNPDIDFTLLWNSIKSNNTAMNAMQFYLSKKGETNLSKTLLQSLEGLLQIGLIVKK